MAAPFFYALPLPVCAAGFALATALSFSGRRFTHAWIGLAATLATGLLWLSSSWSLPPPSSREPVLRIAFWNGADHAQIFSQAADMLEGTDIDIIALAEVEGDSRRDEAAFRQRFPQYQVIRAFGEMAIVVQGSANLVESHRLPNRTNVHVFEMEVNGEPVRLVLADVGPEPYFPRAPLIREIFRIAGDHPGTIVLGDFNTPYESVWFRRYQGGYEHAFVAAGTGLRETWPWPLPALSLDHIWLGSEFIAIRTEKRHRWCSDHAMIIAELDLERP